MSKNYRTPQKTIFNLLPDWFKKAIYLIRIILLKMPFCILSNEVTVVVIKTATVAAYGNAI
jgi:hypothetical protein